MKHRWFSASWLLIMGTLAVAGESAAAQGLGTLAGRAVNVGGRPVDDAEIALAELGRRTRVDETGRFTITDVPAGRYLLEAASPRWGRAIMRVTVAANRTTQVTVELVPAVHLDDIIVSAGVQAQRQSEVYQATEVLSKQDLRTAATNTLGETLSDQPGVSSTYGGPGASRPVIRGLGGDRVRVLESGVGSGDASNTSPDHAVSVEPLTADRIEVIRGPATLLYGSSAIGGVVNVLDSRIPRDRPVRPLSGTVQALGGTVADERNGAVVLLGGAGPVALHAGALGRTTDNYRIPGSAEVAPAPGAQPTGTLANSALSTTRFSFGASFVRDAGFIGVAVSQYDSEYGIPGHHEEPDTTMPAGAPPVEVPVSIDLRQRRFDVEGAWRFAGAAIPRVKVRFGLADYEHVELEGDETGTELLNDSWEARAEAEHGRLGPVTGAFGIQLARRDFSAIGDEVFVPPTATDQYAAFFFEEVAVGRARFQLGARYERQRTRAEQGGGGEITHDAVSVSGGINWRAVPGLAIAVNSSRSVKLPSPEELFSNGPHLATGSFEVGDPTLSREAALSVELGVHVDRGALHGAVTGFVTAFDDFIFQRFTGAVQDNLPELQYAQQDARFFGLEVEGTIEVLHRGQHHVSLELRGDMVRAELTASDEPLPRIPPMRFGGGARYEGGPLTARVGVRRVTRQDRIGPFETVTPGHTLLEASAGYRIITNGFIHEVTLRGTNLTDAEARSHVSFFKDIAPLPGRDVSLAYRLTF